jgi:transcriptional regulator with XRE-family HTH domain
VADVETVGHRLRRVRNAKGLTMVDLASQVGAAEGSVRQIENGSVKQPSFRLGIRLADALNVDPRWLALGDGESATERYDALERRVTKLERQMVEHHGYRR